MREVEVNCGALEFGETQRDASFGVQRLDVDERRLNCSDAVCALVRRSQLTFIAQRSSI